MVDPNRRSVDGIRGRSLRRVDSLRRMMQAGEEHDGTEELLQLVALA